MIGSCCQPPTILVRELDVPVEFPWVEITLPRDTVTVTRSQDSSTSFPLNCSTSLELECNYNSHLNSHTKNVTIIHVWINKNGFLYKKPRTIRPYTTKNFWELARQSLKNRYESAAWRKTSCVHTPLLHETSMFLKTVMYCFGKSQHFKSRLSIIKRPKYLLENLE